MYQMKSKKMLGNRNSNFTSTRKQWDIKPKLSLYVNVPERAIEDREVRVQFDLSVIEINRIICDELQLLYDPSNVSLFKYEKQSEWALEVSSEEDVSKYCTQSIYVRHLCDGDHIEVRKLMGANVGGMFRIAALQESDRFNASLVGKCSELAVQYEGYRRIRGDGNCYYRAVLFGIIEQTVTSGNVHYFDVLHSCFSEVVYPAGKQMESKKKHDELMKCFLDARGKYLHVIYRLSILYLLNCGSSYNLQIRWTKLVHSR